MKMGHHLPFASVALVLVVFVLLWVVVLAVVAAPVVV